MALLFFTSRPDRRELVRSIWASIAPGSAYLAVDDVPDAAYQSQTGLFNLLLIDLDSDHAATALWRFMQRHPGTSRLLTYGGRSRSDWGLLREHLIELGFEKKLEA